MTVTEADWEELDSSPGGQGIATRRLFQSSVHDLFIAVAQPGSHRMLVLRTDANSAARALRTVRSLPRTQGLELQFLPGTDGHHELRVILTSDEMRAVFSPLVVDIARAAQGVEGRAEAVVALVDRFDHWRRMLRTVRDSGMSPEVRRGLFGELAIMRDHVLPELAPVDAVSAWSGPTGAPQDFQFPNGAIEVKTGSGKQPQTIVVSNERELDPTGAGTLLLAHLSVDERRGGEGISLNVLVEELRSALSHSEARTLFDDLLIGMGYLPDQRGLYDEPRYTIRESRFWRVEGDFPRITEAELRPGVGSCTYRIVTSGLESYLATAGEVVAVVKGSA